MVIRHNTVAVPLSADFDSRPAICSEIPEERLIVVGVQRNRFTLRVAANSARHPSTQSQAEDFPVR